MTLALPRPWRQTHISPRGGRAGPSPMIWRRLRGMVALLLTKVSLLCSNPPGHYFDFYIVCTIYLNGTNCMKMSLNFVPLVVHCILNMLFTLVKLFVANGDERPHYSWKKRNTTQQYGSLLVPPRAASNCRKGVSILYLSKTIWRKIEVYLVCIFGPIDWQ